MFARAVFHIIVIVLCAVIAFSFIRKVADDDHWSDPLPRLEIGLFAAPLGAGGDPDVEYDEAASAQYVRLYFPAQPRRGRVGIVLGHVRTCDDDGRGQSARRLKRLRVQRPPAFGETARFLSTIIEPRHPVSVVCRIDLPNAHGNFARRSMAFLLLGSWTHVIDVLPPKPRSMPPWRYINEISLSLRPGRFSNVSLFGGQAIPTHQGARFQDLSRPRSNARTQYMNADTLAAHPFVTAEWTDDQAQTLRDLMLLLTGAVLGLGMTALFELLRLALFGGLLPASVVPTIGSNASSAPPADTQTIVAAHVRRTRAYALVGVFAITTGLLLVSFFTLEERTASLSPHASPGISAAEAVVPAKAGKNSVLGRASDPQAPQSLAVEFYRFGKIATTLLMLGIIGGLFVSWKMRNP